MRGLIVFDCDGTLVDSQHTIVDSMTTAFRSQGRVVPAVSRVRRVVGLSLDAAIEALAPDSSIEDRRAIGDSYRVAFAAARSRGDHEEISYPSVIAALEALSEDGYVLGVATGKSTTGLRTTLSRLGLLGLFATLQTADTAPSKPHPAMLRQAMNDTGAAPENTALIGDTAFDMGMARNAGTSAIGVTWGYHDVDALRRAGAEVLVESAAELPSVVRSMIPTS